MQRKNDQREHYNDYVIICEQEHPFAHRITEKLIKNGRLVPAFKCASFAPTKEFHGRKFEQVFMDKLAIEIRL